MCIRDRNIDIYTLCDQNSVGVIVGNRQREILNEAANNGQNKEYLSTIIDKLNSSKSVEDMNSEEIYQHTITMIIGIDICRHSNICISDYQSNVSRFIKLAHDNPNNVYDILSEKDINYNNKICPAYRF